MDMPRTPKEAAEWMRESERKAAKALRNTAEEILRRPRRRILTIAGPTCSGKTTAAGCLADLFREAGYRVERFSLDDFFREQPTEKRIAEPPRDWDSPDALDHECLYRVFAALDTGAPAEIPIYDFLSGRRKGYRIHTPHPEEIQIWEGIQSLYPTVRTLLGTDTRSIFLDVQPPESSDISGDRIRLFRRIIRDSRTRGASPAYTLHMWPGVRENERVNIYPYTGENQFRLNTFLPYEPFILANHLLPLLESVPADSPYYREAMEYREQTASLRCDFLDTAWIPAGSVLREFIGYPDIPSGTA